MQELRYHILLGNCGNKWGKKLLTLSLQTFVILVTMIREAVDDIRRYRRDKEVNSQKFTKLTRRGPVKVPSSTIKVGDIVMVEKVGPRRCCMLIRSSVIS